MATYEIEEEILPNPIRKTPQFQDHLSQQEAIRACLKNQQEWKKLIDSTRWCRIQVFSKLNNKRRKVLFIKQCEIKDDLKLLKNENFDLIPIVLFTAKGHEIHHVMILKIDNSNVGISMIYNNSSNSVIVTGIHLDKTRICIQHQWISLEHLKECNHECLNNFNTNIDHLQIGNVDADANRIKDLKGKYEKLGKKYDELMKLMRRN